MWYVPAMRSLSKGPTPVVGVRVPGPLWTEFKRGCRDAGVSPSAKIREMIDAQVWEWAGADPFCLLSEND